MSTWREIARELGQRMEHQASSCGAARDEMPTSTGCAHNPAESAKTADTCPFCADHDTYRRWYEKELRALRLDRVRATTAKEMSR